MWRSPSTTQQQQQFRLLFRWLIQVRALTCDSGESASAQPAQVVRYYYYAGLESFDIP